MSQVYRCDRCKTVFEEDKYPRYILHTQYDRFGTEWQKDLCPSCQQELERWFNVQSETN